MRPKILVIIGLRCSGKQTAKKYLTEKLGYKRSIDLSDDIIRPIAKERRVTNLVDFLPLYKSLGTDFLFNKLAEAIDKSEEEIVISSIRELALFEMLKKKYANKLSLLYLSTDPSMRFERFKKRGRKEGIETLKDLLSFEEAENKVHRTEELIEKADFLIRNNGKAEDLFEQLKKLFSK